MLASAVGVSDACCAARLPCTAGDAASPDVTVVTCACTDCTVTWTAPMEVAGTLKEDAREDAESADVPSGVFVPGVIERVTVYPPLDCRARAVPWCSWRREEYTTWQLGAVQAGVRAAATAASAAEVEMPAGNATAITSTFVIS